MPINTIIIIIFLILLILAAFLFRNSTLDKLTLLDGESVLFEEKCVRVEQAGSPSDVLFFGCIVRVTNMRIIIAQKMLFREKYALRHVIEYNCGDDRADLAATLRKGYIIMRIEKEALKITGSADDTTVSIAIPDTALTRGQYISFKTACGEKYRELAQQGDV